MSGRTSGADVALFVIRAGLGAAIAAHGAQKLVGAFGGGGLEGTGGFFESVGFAPGKEHARASALAETFGGLGIAAGLATPVAGAAVAGNMIVAGSMHTDKGFFGQDGGFEQPATYGLAGAALALGGPGRISLDAALGGALDRPWMRVAALIAAPVGAAIVLGRRKRTLAERAHVDGGAGPAASEETSPA